MRAPGFGAAYWARRVYRELERNVTDTGDAYTDDEAVAQLEKSLGALIAAVRYDEARKCLRASVDADEGKECEAIDARVRLHRPTARRKRA
jgi:hypothetical protein